MRTQLSFTHNTGQYHKKLSVIKELFLMLSIMLLSDEALYFGQAENSQLVTIKNGFIVVFFFIFLYRYFSKKEKFSQTEKRALLILVFTLFFSMVVNLDFRKSYLFQIIIIITGFLYARTVDKYRFMRLFETAVLIIASYSLIIYLLSIFTPNFLIIFPSFIDKNANEYINAYLTFVPSFSYRLWGPFREPGVYIIFLNIAFLFHIITNRKLNVVKTIIFVTTIMFSYSTTGYITMAFIILYYINKTSKEKNRKKIPCLAIFFIIIGFYYLWQSDIFNKTVNIFLKLTDIENHSSASRFSSVITNLKIFIRNPLFGVGITDTADLFAEYNQKIYHMAVTDNVNTYLKSFAQYGLLYGSVLVIGIYKFAKKSGSSRISSFIAFLALVLLFSAESTTASIIFFSLIEYGFMTTIDKHYV